MDVVRSIWPRAFVFSWFMDRLGPMIILDHIDCYIRLQSSRLFLWQEKVGASMVDRGGSIGTERGSYIYGICKYIIKYRKSEQGFVCA